jgi:hypothetical protein
MSLKLASFTLPGAIAGSIIATTISDTLFQKILAYVLIGIIISLLLPRPNQKKIEDSKHYQKNWFIYPAMTSWCWIPAHGIALPSDETRPCPCQYAQDIYRIYLYYSGTAYLFSYTQCGFQVWFYLGSRKCTWGMVVRKVFCEKRGNS